MERVNIVPAEVISGVVWIEQNGIKWPATDVVIQGQGSGDSTGFALIGDTEIRYITNTQVDIAFILDRLIGICEQVEVVGNKQDWIIAVAGVAVPVIAPFPDLVAAATEVATIRTELENLDLK